MKTEISALIATLKASFVKVLLIILAFLVPIVPLLLIVGVCIALDTLFGIWRAKRQGEKITSRKLSAVISKMVLYQTAIILFYAIEYFILSDILAKFTDIHLLLTKLVAATLIFIELKSINESFVFVKGFSLWDKFKEMITRAKSFKGEISEFTKDNTEPKEPEI